MYDAYVGHPFVILKGNSLKAGGALINRNPSFPGQFIASYYNTRIELSAVVSPIEVIFGDSTAGPSSVGMKSNWSRKVDESDRQRENTSRE